jgi:hypothetical protein
VVDPPDSLASGTQVRPRRDVKEQQ